MEHNKVYNLEGDEEYEIEEKPKRKRKQENSESMLNKNIRCSLPFDVNFVNCGNTDFNIEIRNNVEGYSLHDCLRMIFMKDIYEELTPIRFNYNRK